MVNIIKDELISIIIPIYNVEKYLEKCIDSVTNQTYKNIEIILINDGSKDKSSNICDIYKEKDSRIIVVHKENGGLSSARNEGIKIAKGKYISFLDSDDWITNDFIENLYNLIKDTDSDIAVSEYKEVYTEDEIIENNDVKINIYNNEEALEFISSITATAKLFSKEFFSNIKFPIGKIHEDEFVFHYIFYKAKKVVYTNKQMYMYRQREGSIMSSQFSIKRLDAIEAFEDRIEFYKQKKLFNLIDKTNVTYINILKRMIIRLEKSTMENKKEIMNIVYKKLLEKYKEIKINKYININKYIYIKLTLMFPKIFKKIILLRGIK